MNITSLPNSANLPISAILVNDKRLPTNFPTSQWNYQAMLYQEAWEWFLGEALKQTIPQAQTETGEPVYRWPLQINPLAAFAQRHAAVLIGEVPETDDAVVRVETIPFRLPFEDQPSEESVRVAKAAETFLNLVWSENSGRALQIENALICQFLSGCVFKVSFWPDPDLLVPIRLETVLPDFFLPVWEATDYFNLIEAFVAYYISPIEAKVKYGIQTDATEALYVEHWTRKTVTITVDDQPVTIQFGDYSITYQNHEHNFGFVPFVYIPKMRAGDFYGLPSFQNLDGLTKEFNARSADLGDAIREGVHGQVFVSNLRGSLGQVPLPGGRSAVNLGPTQPGSDPPNVKRLEPPMMAPTFMEYNDWLWSQMLRQFGLSPIAFGEDEGSQRSALTLAFRMWPLTSMARQTRSFWTAGLTVLDKMIFNIAAQKKLFGFKPEHSKLFRITQNWPPMIPRDREQVVNEVVLLFTAGAIPLENVMERLGDIKDPEIKDPEATIEKVWEDLQKKMDIQGKAKKAIFPPGVNAPIAEAITGDQ